MTPAQSLPFDRAVLTIASGPEVFWTMAVNLARSLRLWHSPEELPVVIATDRERTLPPDLTGVSLLRFQPAELGQGFEIKLHLDRLAPARHTLFIDADCLAYGSLDPIFSRFQGQPVGVVGTTISSGEWFGDVAAYCERLGVAALPKFNGGLYYVEPGPAADAVYSQARELSSHYDELGLKRLRNLPNDELVIAGAMAQLDLQAVPNDGSLMSDPLSFPEHPVSNIFQGAGAGRRTPALIMHFLGDHAQRPPYRTEALRLALAARGWPRCLASVRATLFLLWPGRCVQVFKALFRPAFRALFGSRKPASSLRMQP